MVISVIVENFIVHKIMTDSGSATNILFYNVFERIKLSKDRLALVQCTLYGFDGEIVMLE